PRSAANPVSVSAAADLLRAATRPLVLAGNGVFWAGASDTLVSLVERLQAPVLVSPAARGIVPFDHRSYVPAARSKAMKAADVVLLVGSRLNFMLAYGQPPRLSAETKLIQIDVNPDELGNNRALDVALAGDAAIVLEQLLNELDQRGDSEWLDELHAADRERRAGLVADSMIDATPVHPLRLLAELGEVLEPDAFVACDGGDILSFARQALPSTGPGGWLDSGPFGSLGYGIPAASAAKIASPERQCVALLGDGALGLQAMELDTAARHGLGILVVISTNGAWAIETTSQEMEFGRATATELERRPYHQLAETLGCDAIEVLDPAELRAALGRAPRDRPLVVNVQTDPAAKSPDAVRGLGLVPREQAVKF
ncbi:MAG: thiamine pyrophosphate-binding protein, partial [Gaiellaceae bacterium]